MTHATYAERVLAECRQALGPAQREEPHQVMGVLLARMFSLEADLALARARAKRAEERLDQLCDEVCVLRGRLVETERKRNE